nr:MAG TPA: tail tube protein [Caudoviricetes sp.]DAT69811.1 MAG TPA: tail tube protein [Caudoviricetes sp.]
MPRLIWDAIGEKFYEMGTKMGVLYPMNNEGTYENGVAWNGLTAVTESPSGAEETKLYADDIKYASLRSAEDYGFTIEAYTYPPEWEPCDGSAQVATGVTIGQQKRKAFGFSWVTTVGNDVTDEAGQKIHVVWNSTASPSEKSYATINDNPDAITFSWECSSSPVNVANHRPTSHLEINCAKLKEKTVKAIQDKLWGGESTEATLPTPDELIALVTTNEAA